MKTFLAFCAAAGFVGVNAFKTPCAGLYETKPGSDIFDPLLCPDADTPTKDENGVDLIPPPPNTGFCNPGFRPCAYACADLSATADSIQKDIDPEDSMKVTFTPGVVTSLDSEPVAPPGCNWLHYTDISFPAGTSFVYQYSVNSLLVSFPQVLDSSRVPSLSGSNLGSCLDISFGSGNAGDILQIFPASEAGGDVTVTGFYGAPYGDSVTKFEIKVDGIVADRPGENGCPELPEPDEPDSGSSEIPADSEEPEPEQKPEPISFIPDNFCTAYSYVWDQADAFFLCSILQNVFKEQNCGSLPEGCSARFDRQPECGGWSLVKILNPNFISQDYRIEAISGDPSYPDVSKEEVLTFRKAFCSLDIVKNLIVDNGESIKCDDPCKEVRDIIDPPTKTGTGGTAGDGVSAGGTAGDLPPADGTEGDGVSAGSAAVVPTLGLSIIAAFVALK